MSANAVVMWFRKSLRVHDNLALQSAVSCAVSEQSRLYACFVIDPHFISPETVGVARMNFLLESLQDLDSTLKKHGSRLLVVRGKPEELLNFMKHHKVGHLYFEKDTEPYAKVRDEKITKEAKALGAKVTSCHGHMLFDPDFLVAKSKAKGVPKTMGAFQALISSVGHPAKPVPSEVVMKGACTVGDVEKCLVELPSHNYAVPTLEELGYPSAAQHGSKRLFHGGESTALKKLEDFAKADNGRLVKNFEKPNTSPAAFKTPSTTTLSPYMKFGCLSPRMFYHKVQQVGTATKPPVSLIGQLYWREHFHLLGYVTENFDKMRGNEGCRQIPWDTNADYLNAWETGKTGFPWIDAIMRQLVNEGWMHHLARHSVACFLTRGDLWISWEEGMKVFDKYLIDADWHLNAANWQWLSCSAFFHQYFRVYSPVAFPKKYDKTGAFVKNYVPELKNMPEKYIYEPWTAPIDVQKRAGCIIGKDYPKPIVDHATVSKKNISRMAAAFEANKAGVSSEGPPTKKQKK